MGSVDPVRKTAPKNANPWRLFKGDDLTYPVEMFVHIMEFKDAQPTQTGLVPESQIDVPDQGSTDKLIQSVLNHIPDPKYSSKGSNAALGGKTDPPASLNVPASMWKHKMVKDGLDLQGWNAVKENLLSEFGQGEKDYTLKEKLALLQSVGKGPYEDSQAYLVRIRCLVSLLTNNKIPTESINQLPGVNDTWVRVLFLFGLDDIEQNLLVEEADVKGLEELCDVLALPEVKMIRRADDTMKRANEEGGGVPEESGRGKRKRKSQNYAAMAKGESIDVVPMATPPQKRARGAVKIELLPEEEPDFASEPIKLEPTLGELQADEDDFWGDGSATAPIEAVEEGSVLNPRQIKRKKAAEKKKASSSGGAGANEKPKKRTSWPCVFCEEVFPTNAALRKHQDEAHEGFHDKCEQCDIKFFKVADLQAHNNKFHAEKKEKNKKYKKYVYDQISAQIEEAQRDETLEVRPLLQIVRKNEIPGVNPKDHDSYVCNICPNDVYLHSFAAMDEHIQNIHNGSRFKCDLCDFTPSPKSGIACLVDHRLKKHQVGTEGYPYYKCLEKSEDCTYYASSVRDLVDHMLSSVHASDAARYKVQEEGNFYWAAGKEPFGEAEASADKADVYVVPRSSVVFVNSKKYRKCLICDELCTAKQGRFNQDADGLCLKEHAAEKHDGKLYKCDICNKLFGDRLNVALHVKRQHGLEPLGFNLLECHYPGCKAVFKTKSDFGHHIVSHKVKNETNDMTELEHVAFEKPLMPTDEPAEMTKIGDIGKMGKLQCDICGMTCTNKDPALELELHMEMEHSDKILFCEHCGEDFKDPHSLSYHLRNKHMQQVTGNTRKFDKKKRKEYHDEWVKNAPKKYVTTPEGKTMLAASWKKKNRPQVQCPLCKLVGDQDTLVYHFRMIHLQYKRWGCTICQKRFPSSSNTKYHILRVHEGKGNMDGKLKSVVGVDYFEGKNLLEDFKETEPSNWPNKKCVLEAIAKAREDALTSQLVIVPVTQTITQITVAEEPDGERLIE